MIDRTHFQPLSTEWHDLDQPTVDPDDTLRASIHPGGQSVTFNYWASEDDLVLNVAHLDALVSLVLRVKAANRERPSEKTDDTACSAGTARVEPRTYPRAPQTEVQSEAWINPTDFMAEESGS